MEFAIDIIANLKSFIVSELISLLEMTIDCGRFENAKAKVDSGNTTGFFEQSNFITESHETQRMFCFNNFEMILKEQLKQLEG